MHEYRMIYVMKRIFALFVTVIMAIAIAPRAIAGPTVVGVDGTIVQLPIDILEGALALNDNMLTKLPGYQEVVVKYPQSFGLFTFSAIGYDKSVAIGKAGTINAIKQAQNGDPSVPVKVACHSQGSDVCTQANDQLRNDGYNQSSVTYFLEGNVDNAYLGIKVWIPHIGKNGVFIPGPGVTLGNATPTAGSDAQINQVSYEYDGFARTPEYPINLLADLNAVVGTLLEHGSYSKADPYAPNNIVSTTPDGKITNIMIPVNVVPLLTVAKFFGLPQQIVDIVNPTLKAIIDTAYSPVPNGPGTYPTKAVTVKLFPSKEKLQTDIKNVQQGLAESKNKLAALFKPPIPAITTSKSSSGALNKPTSSDSSNTRSVTQDVAVQVQQPKRNGSSPTRINGQHRQTSSVRSTSPDTAKQASNIHPSTPSTVSARDRHNVKRNASRGSGNRSVRNSSGKS
ncbi:MAG: PE-PPE domain-containing protein [Candidatus Nomurabacteria bacterium]|nr:MAG: PE-PPE domain-containing protein [Candidatus Nomurabacteria bacterium]